MVWEGSGSALDDPPAGVPLARLMASGGEPLIELEKPGLLGKVPCGVRLRPLIGREWCGHRELARRYVQYSHITAGLP